MNFLEIAEKRYTTKSYDNTRKLTETELSKLKEIVRLSPSSINSQPWKFIFVTDETVKTKLAEASYFNAQRILESSCLVIFCAIDSIQLFEEQIEVNLPNGAVGYYNEFLKPLGEHKIKSWFAHQVYLSLGFFLSACATNKIDSTPMEGIINSEYDKILSLNNYKTLFSVAIGYRNSEDKNQPFMNPKKRMDFNDIILSI